MASPNAVRVAASEPAREADTDPSTSGPPAGAARRVTPLDALLAGGNRAATGVLAPAEGTPAGADAVAARALSGQGPTTDPAAPVVPDGMPDVDLDRDTDEALTVDRVATVVADLVSDFVPVVSNIKDAWAALTGVNAVTGERLGPLDRAAAGIFAIPALGNVVKYLAKGGRLLTKAMIVLARALDRLVERLPRLLNRLRDWVTSTGDVVDEIADLLSGPVFAHQAGGGRGGGGGGVGGTGPVGGGGSPSREPAHLAEGKRKHREHAEAARATPMEHGFEPLAIERRLTLRNGRTVQPDSVYVNHKRRMLIIEDQFTGPEEPLKHKLKSWLATQSVELDDLITNRGYTVEIVSAMSHPVHKQ